MQVTRGSGFCILEFRRRHTRRQLGKHRTGDVLGIHPELAMDTVMNTREECVPALSAGMSAGMPAFIIKTAQKGRQACSKMDRLVSPEGVSQCVQSREQPEIDALAVMPSEPPHEVIDPIFRRVEGGVEFSDCCHTHAFPSLSGDQTIGI